MSEDKIHDPRHRAGFEFVVVASARARQLVKGCVPRVEGSAKPARRAQQEVRAGHVQRARTPGHE